MADRLIARSRDALTDLEKECEAVDEGTILLEIKVFRGGIRNVKYIRSEKEKHYHVAEIKEKD